MFASLKNKIREETGSDISKLTSKISSSTTSVQQRLESLRGRHSRQGSTSSINSLVSLDGIREDASSSNDSKTEEEVKRRLSKVELEYMKKLDDKETEWKERFEQQEKRIKQLEGEKENVSKITFELREQLTLAEDYKHKLMEYQEDKEQLENFQTQEIAKVKHLVLLREQELAEKTSAFKDCTQQLEKLRTELSRLRRQEELLSDVQDELETLRHSSARDLTAIASELARSQEERKHLSELLSVLRQRTESSEGSTDDQSVLERKMLEARLEEAHLHLADIKSSWSDKISALETQVGRLSRQAAEESAERRRAVEEREVLSEKVKQMECELECQKMELSNKDSKINRLIKEIEDLTTEMKSTKSDSDEEVTFLRNQLETSINESSDLKLKINQTVIDLKSMESEKQLLLIDVDRIKEKNEELQTKIQKLEDVVKEERSQNVNIQKELNKEISEKNVAFLRNAEISQQMEIIKQDSRHKENEITELLSKVTQLELALKEMKELESKVNVENELRTQVAELEEQLADKNKNIKTLQMRLTDMKKTLQQELRGPNNLLNNHGGDNISMMFENSMSSSSSCNPVAVINPSQSTTKQQQHHSNCHKDEDDINFKYLKHVIIKFLTSREYEAQHLTRAVATLLKLSPDEEKLLHDTLEYRMSWFGTKPNLGIGQTAKAIPPS